MERSRYCDTCNNHNNCNGVNDMEHIEPSCYKRVMTSGIINMENIKFKGDHMTIYLLRGIENYTNGNIETIYGAFSSIEKCNEIIEEITKINEKTRVYEKFTITNLDIDIPTKPYSNKLNMLKDHEKHMDNMRIRQIMKAINEF